MIRTLNWLTFALVALAPQFGRAEIKGVVKGDFSSVNVTEKYRINANTKVYDKASRVARHRIKLDGSGELTFISSNVNEKNTAVPGVNLNGYERFEPTLKDGRLLLLRQTAVDDEIEGFRFNYTSRVNIETEFVEGSAADFQRGQRVVVKATAAGRTALATEEARVYTDLMRVVLTNLASTEWVYTSELNQADVADDLRYEITPTELNATNSKLRYLVTITASR